MGVQKTADLANIDHVTEFVDVHLGFFPHEQAGEVAFVREHRGAAISRVARKLCFHKMSLKGQKLPVVHLADCAGRIDPIRFAGSGISDQVHLLSGMNALLGDGDGLDVGRQFLELNQCQIVPAMLADDLSGDGQFLKVFSIVILFRNQFACRIAFRKDQGAFLTLRLA